MKNQVRINCLFFTIIFLSVLIRIYGINSPVLDHHSIRQVDTASIARNFFENGMNIFYPQFDGGGVNNYVECEFQLYTYTVAMLYKIFGVKEILGRILSITLFYLTAVYLYKLVASIYDDIVAKYSVAIFTILPLSITVSRSYQPESMMLLFTVASIYYCYKWMQTERLSYEVLTYLFVTLTVLTKLPTLYLGLPLLYVIIKKRGIKYIYNPRLLVMLGISVITVFSWYYHAHSLFLEYGNTFIGGGNKFSDLELLTDFKFYAQIFVNRFGGIAFTPLGYLLLITGILLPRANDDHRIFDYWLLSVIVYIFIAGKGNLFHDYYQYPIMPVAAVYIGKSLMALMDNTSVTDISSIRWIMNNRAISAGVIFFAYLLVASANITEKSIKATQSISISSNDVWQVISLVLIISTLLLVYRIAAKYYSTFKVIDVFAVVTILFSSVYFIKLNDIYKVDLNMLEFANMLAAATSSNDIVASTTESSNGQLYYAHRKGWTFFRSLPSVANLKSVQAKGATVFITNRVDELNKCDELINYLSLYDKLYLGNGYIMFSFNSKGLKYNGA